MKFFERDFEGNISGRGVVNKRPLVTYVIRCKWKTKENIQSRCKTVFRNVTNMHTDMP
jgi:hypothetical protein